MYEGGGLEMARRMFHAQGVHNIPCGLIPPEASGWFREEIRSINDLKGMKMRFFGLGAKVMQKMGVETVQIPPGEIFAALQSGDLDAAEFSLPAMDQPLGFQKVAKYYYFPGWHQQATFFDLDINLVVWESLADRHKAISNSRAATSCARWCRRERPRSGRRSMISRPRESRFAAGLLSFSSHSKTRGTKW